MFAPLAKWVAEIDRTERIPEYISRAFHVAQSGRPGPVVLALPEDMLSAACEAAVTRAFWPARMQRLTTGPLFDIAPRAELWLDGGHNPAAGQVIGAHLATLPPRPTASPCYRRRLPQVLR